MNDYTLDKPLWVHRSVEETRELYRDWAADYDADVLGAGYLTPKRIAEALKASVADDAEVLDFGCGTGISGEALIDAGFSKVDGTDITPEMLEIAREKSCYRKLWLSEPGELSVENGRYKSIVAAGVVSLGAAPPETLDDLLEVLGKEGILAFSYNDPTLDDQSYVKKLEDIIQAGTATLLFKQHGPHLPEKGMGSEVIILRKS